MADVCPFAGFLNGLRKLNAPGVISTPKEFSEQQFGMPFKHYAQQYLFGSTGLRIGVFHSIAGAPASCKSPLLFDLMGHVCADNEHGGLGGLSVLYELEDKISQTLLNGVLSQYGPVRENGSFLMVSDLTLDQAMGHVTKVMLKSYHEYFPNNNVPLVLGFDSIGGAASQDTVEKLKKEGAISKGYYDKPHQMKYFCENISKLLANIPYTCIFINQEKEQAASTPYGPPQKKITGGMSQVFKDGHMISASYRTLASGDGKIITLRTTKTSFCDSRKIEVNFRWNKFGDYQHHFEWGLAAANCLASPEKGVGDLRDIAAVKVSDQGLVTCPQLGCRSVTPDEFEAALFAPENAKTLEDLQSYQKIEKLKTVQEYIQRVQEANGLKPEYLVLPLEDEPEPEPKATRKAKPVKAGRRRRKAAEAPTVFDVLEQEAKQDGQGS